MNTHANQPTHDDDMPPEIDFTGAVRGKFFNADARLNVPLYLDAPI